MTHIVAVDGGASRCRLAMYSMQGDLQARVTIDSHASLSMGVQAAWQHVMQGLERLRRQMGFSSDWLPAVLSMGLAGSLRQLEREEFLALIPPPIDARLFTDGYAQLCGASAGKPGICLSVGTGSVVHWLDEQGANSMAGGWGYPVGDQGSGAWLGLKAIQHVVSFRDQGKQGGALFCAVLERTGHSQSDIQSWTTQTRSSVMAQLAPLVLEAAASQDPVAIEILSEAADHCIELIGHAPDTLPVFVVGGVGSQLTHLLEVQLGCRLQKAHGDALLGLWHLAKNTTTD